jgi:NADH dehydrogenase FAD-containing subunit
MMAQPAMQQGGIGENVVKLIENKSMQAFEYNDKGSMATIKEIKRLSICQNTILVVFLHGLSDVCPLVFPLLDSKIKLSYS